MKKLFLVAAVIVIAVTTNAQTLTFKGTGTGERQYSLNDNHLNNLPQISLVSPVWYSWLVLNRNNHQVIKVDNPDQHNGAYIIHFYRKRLYWVNDSTATYLPDTLKSIK